MIPAPASGARLPSWRFSSCVIGLFPMVTAAWLVDAAASAVTGEAVTAKITHWHGLEAAALWMSLAAFGGGLMALGAYPRLRALWDATPRPEAKPIFDGIIEPLAALAPRRDRQPRTTARFSRAVAVAVLAIAGRLALGLLGRQPCHRHPRASAGRRRRSCASGR